MFRKNVAALIICEGKYLGCYRADHHTWQCVQGGMETIDNTPQHAIIREIKEELGVQESDFKVTYQSKFWRRYYFTKDILKQTTRGNHIGQDQLWFLAELNSINSICLEKSHCEFSKVELFDIDFLLKQYSHWKRAPFYDFCREANLWYVNKRSP